MNYCSRGWKYYFNLVFRTFNFPFHIRFDQMIIGKQFFLDLNFIRCEQESPDGTMSITFFFRRKDRKKLRELGATLDHIRWIGPFRIADFRYTRAYLRGDTVYSEIGKSEMKAGRRYFNGSGTIVNTATIAMGGRNGQDIR